MLPILSICFFLFSCKKQIPEITHEGADTFGYYTHEMHYAGSLDTFTVGGNRDLDDEVIKINDSTYHFSLRDHRSAHMFQSTKWRILDFDLTWTKEHYPVTHYAHTMSNLYYIITYEDVDENFDLLNFEYNQVFVIDSTDHNDFSVTHRHLNENYLAARFHFNLIQQIDSVTVDSNSVVEIRGGRFDINL